MKFSVITTCFNRAGTIRETIESALAQDYRDMEYIVVDGASTDGTREIVREYAERIDKVVSEKDGGMYEAINKGIRLATGDVICLLHSDDVFFDTHTLSDVARAFEQTGADLVYADGIYVNAEKPQQIVRNWIGGKYSRRKVGWGWLPLHPTCYIRREVMLREGLYDERYKIAADTDLLIRYLYERTLRVKYLHRYVVRMRMGGLSTDRQKRQMMWKEDVEIYRSHGFAPVSAKLMKMAWKVPQFISAKFVRI